ncbi:MAG: hypothetical protein HYS14_02350 [Candidatus Rokubacteria bacterium]|jgi:hypothetical protein|nr:hypothetical protein [Candidatus Rokubacteria bacterium]
MGKKRIVKPPPRKTRWHRLALGTFGLVAVAAVTAWWLWSAPEVSGGTPRLVLDRDVVELGYLPFESPARVMFTLTNTGDGVLKLADIPRVKVLKGC